MNSTKFCPGCEQTLPRTDFYPRSKGSHLVQSRCKKCHTSRNSRDLKAARERDWVGYNQRKREDYARRMQDPEYAAKQKEKWRANYEKNKNKPSYREARKVASRFYREKNGTKLRLVENHDTSVERIQPEPILSWIDDQLSKSYSLADICGSEAHERAIRRVRDGEQNYITVPVVDSILTRNGWHLLDLYPDLYDAA